jgi:hypothetical protein
MICIAWEAFLRIERIQILCAIVKKFCTVLLNEKGERLSAFPTGMIFSTSSAKDSL